MPDPTSHTALRVILALRKLKYASTQKIADELGQTKKYVSDTLAKLREEKRVYIADWGRTGETGDLKRIYAIRLLGEKDEPKPKPISNIEKTRRYRTKLKALRAQKEMTWTSN